MRFPVNNRDLVTHATARPDRSEDPDEAAGWFGDYSLRNDSIGSTFDARRAGR